MDKLNIAKIFYFLFLGSLFFSIRYVFPTKDAFQTGAYSDFTSISLYLSDIFLFLTVLFAFSPPRTNNSFSAKIPYKQEGNQLENPDNNQQDILLGRHGWSKITDKGLWIFIIWLILGLFSHFSNISELNWWFFFKYLELIVAYGTTVYLFNKSGIKQQFYQFFLIFTSFESILAVWQFVIQKSLGLGRIGEQLLSPEIIGVAKIVSGGTKYIRGYGTFPHPNLLSAFLTVGILISLYLLVNSAKKYQKIVYSLALFINIVGLTVTFSRAGFLAVGVGLIILLGYLAIKNQQTYKKAVATSAFLIIISCLFSFIIFKPYLLTRSTITDQASIERVFYVKTAWQMIKQHPVIGVGIGESVLHMQQYSVIKLWPWQNQPVHNYFLLTVAELGVPGALILIWIFFSHLKAISYPFDKLRTGKLQTKLTTYNLLLTTVLICFLILMQFDHYFYTLQQTQMLLWVILGIIAAETNQKNPSAK